MHGVVATEATKPKNNAKPSFHAAHCRLALRASEWSLFTVSESPPAGACPCQKFWVPRPLQLWIGMYREGWVCKCQQKTDFKKALPGSRRCPVHIAASFCPR